MAGSAISKSSNTAGRRMDTSPGWLYGTSGRLVPVKYGKKVVYFGEKAAEDGKKSHSLSVQVEIDLDADFN
jgi:hypothetical protein